jgi:hypothetical protein
MVTDKQKGQNNNNIVTLSLLELLIAAKNSQIFFPDLRGVKIFKFGFPDLGFWAKKRDNMIKS